MRKQLGLATKAPFDIRISSFVLRLVRMKVWVVTVMFRFVRVVLSVSAARPKIRLGSRLDTRRKVG